MLPIERQRLIYNRVMAEQRVLVSSLAEEMNMSVETIRKDIKILDQQGLVKQVHGGAVALGEPRMQRNPEMEKRRTTYTEERRRIAQQAVDHLEMDDVIVLSAGATMDEMARLLPDNYRLTVFTNSISAMNILVHRCKENTFDGQVFILGGFTDSYDMCVFGEMTNEMIKALRFDKAFLSATTVSTEGPMLSNISEGITSNLLMKQSSKSFLLATSHKFGHTSLYCFGTLKDLDCIITDSTKPLPKNILAAIEEDEISLIIS